RQAMGGATLSDEELLLRYIMKGESEIKAMRAAGPPRQYLGVGRGLVSLVREMSKRNGLGHLRLERGSDWIELGRQPG
ncbi:MAG: hypothetical protein QGF09_11415, partial [Rhodospirillales bacterium]|nr:hypothetical protein [Rhodospirillales bacterium]